MPEVVEMYNRNFSITYNNNICDFIKYNFSNSIFFEFYNLRSDDMVGGKHTGKDYFRIDFTKSGRFECEFIDHTYSYRGENEITLIATDKNEEWILGSSFPMEFYQGCALIIKLDELANEDILLLKKFGIDIFHIINIMNFKHRWYKIMNQKFLVDLFKNIYEAHEIGNEEKIWIRVFEILIYFSKEEFINKHIENIYYPEHQVRRVKEIHNYINNNFSNDISVEHMVKENGISYSSFNKIFKTMYGESPYQYLKKLRIKLAANKLIETDLSILQIAISVGYSNPSKFSCAFKAVMGTLPSIYRKTKTEWSIENNNGVDYIYK